MAGNEMLHLSFSVCKTKKTNHLVGEMLVVTPPLCNHHMCHVRREGER